MEIKKRKRYSVSLVRSLETECRMIASRVTGLRCTHTEYLALRQRYLYEGRNGAFDTLPAYAQRELNAYLRGLIDQMQHEHIWWAHDRGEGFLPPHESRAYYDKIQRSAYIWKGTQCVWQEART